MEIIPLLVSSIDSECWNNWNEDHQIQLPASKNTHIQLVINVIIHTKEKDMKCMYNVTLWCAQTFASWPLLRWSYHLLHCSHTFIVQEIVHTAITIVWLCGMVLLKMYWMSTMILFCWTCQSYLTSKLHPNEISCNFLQTFYT